MVEVIKERFPLTIGVLAFWSFAVVTLPFIGLSVDSTPILSQKANVLLGMFLTGGLLLIATSIVFGRFTGGSLKLVTPEKPFQGWTLAQALIIITGFITISVWQLFVNQAFFGVALASYQSGSTLITPGPATATIFKLDAAIAEESLMLVAIPLYLTLAYILKADKRVSIIAVLLMVGGFFTWLHYYVLGTNAAALVFVFGARVILTGTMFLTLYFSRKMDPSTHRKLLAAASIAAPNAMHFGWNVLS